jgi:ATP-dependent Clp protease ATP-binding subunit ClpC
VTVEETFERRMTTPVREVLARAKVEAQFRVSPSVEPDHLLCALLGGNDSAANRLLRGLGRSPGALRAELRCRPGELSEAPALDSSFSDGGHSILNRARDLADEFHHPRIGTEHILLALVEAKTPGVERLLEYADADEDEIRRALFGGHI